MNRLPVVLDKSFAHPKKAETIKEWLCKERTVILPRAFYYEVFTTTDDIRGNRIVTAAQKRIAAIRGMGEHIPLHLPSLLQEEALLKSPLIPPYILSRYPFERFSQSYLSEDWTPKNHQVSILNYYSDHINYMCDFWRNVLISQYIPCFSKLDIDYALRYTTKFDDICQRLNSADFIREIAMHINQPNATLLDSTWIRFRFIQSLILQALILLQSYPNFNIHIKSIEDDELKKDFLTNINIRMEHDAHDLEYLILGLHFGSLATEETSKANKSMSSRFRLLSPNGELLTLNSIIEPSP